MIHDAGEADEKPSFARELFGFVDVSKIRRKTAASLFNLFVVCVLSDSQTTIFELFRWEQYNTTRKEEQTCKEGGKLPPITYNNSA